MPPAESYRRAQSGCISESLLAADLHPRESNLNPKLISFEPLCVSFVVLIPPSSLHRPHLR